MKETFLTYTRKLWLPVLVGTFGVLFSFFLWYQIQHGFELKFINEWRAYHPWIDLLFGMSLSILLAIIIGVAQVSRERAESLKSANIELKNEIAERITVEQTKQKLELALLQGQKLQAIGTLAGGIAHDFNNILYAIIGYIELARDDVAKESLTYKNLGKVLDACHRGQELIARILAFSRRQHHDFSALKIKQVIEAVLSLLRPTIPASVTIHFEPTTDVEILGNQTQLHQVLVNLINNAVDAMDGEGNIDISIGQVTKGDPILKQIPDAHTQDFCKIEISDTGSGMSERVKERIFEPFFTTKEVGRGTGLGLSIVHSIIQEHQGEILIESELGHGTTFILLIPKYIAA